MCSAQVEDEHLAGGCALNQDLGLIRERECIACGERMPIHACLARGDVHPGMTTLMGRAAALAREHASEGLSDDLHALVLAPIRVWRRDGPFDGPGPEWAP